MLATDQGLHGDIKEIPNFQIKWQSSATVGCYTRLDERVPAESLLPEVHTWTLNDENAWAYQKPNPAAVCTASNLRRGIAVLYFHLFIAHG